MQATAAIICLAFIFFNCASSLNTRRGGSDREIANGIIVDYSTIKSSYPFMTRLIMDAAYRCGGALVADRFVATSRHCIEKCPCYSVANPSNDWTRCRKICIVKFRENSDFESDTETIHEIKTIHVPLDSGKVENGKTDFALIEMTKSANICTPEETADGRCWPVTPVRLPPPSITIKLLQEVRTLGWGATEFSFAGEQAEFLAQLDLSINSSTRFQYLLETNVGVAGADPCTGDSGGPLLLREDDLEWTLVGTLVGGGFDCLKPFDRSDNTSHWNKISVHVPWINSIVGGEKLGVIERINPKIKEPITLKPKPTIQSCDGLIRDFPNALDNYKVCMQMKAELVKADWFKATRKFCDQSEDLLNTLIETNCAGLWCDTAIKNKQTWEQENSQECQDDVPDDKKQF